RRASASSAAFRTSSRTSGGSSSRSASRAESARMDRLCAVSVDLDEIPCYTAIHGLPTPRDDRAHAVYRAALPRLASLFEELAIPATLCAIGRDLATRSNGRALRRLAQAGHEIGNHTQHHWYDLTRRPREVMAREV